MLSCSLLCVQFRESAESTLNALDLIEDDHKCRLTIATVCEPALAQLWPALAQSIAHDSIVCRTTLTLSSTCRQHNSSPAIVLRRKKRERSDRGGEFHHDHLINWKIISNFTPGGVSAVIYSSKARVVVFIALIWWHFKVFHRWKGRQGSRRAQAGGACRQASRQEGETSRQSCWIIIITYSAYSRYRQEKKLCNLNQTQTI